MSELSRMRREICWLQCTVLLLALSMLIQTWRIHEVERIVYSLQGLVYSINDLVSVICRILLHHCWEVRI